MMTMMMKKVGHDFERNILVEKLDFEWHSDFFLSNRKLESEASEGQTFLFLSWRASPWRLQTRTNVSDWIVNRVRSRQVRTVVCTRAASHFLTPL